MRPVSAPRPIDYLIVALLYFAAARASLAVTASAGNLVTLWLPNAVLVAAAIWFRGRYLLQFVAVAIVARLAADFGRISVPESLLLAAINGVQAWVASRLLSIWRFDARFADLKDTVKFALVGPVVASGIAALLGASTLLYYRTVDASLLELFRSWWFADALGLILVTPLLLTIADRLTAGRPWVRPSSTDIAMATVAALLTIGILPSSANAVMGMPLGPILLVPFVFYFSARGGPVTASAVVAMFSAVVLSVILTRGGFFAQTPPRTATIIGQEFIVIVSQSALGLAAVLEQVRRRQAALEESNSALRAAESEILALNNDLERRVLDRTRDLEQALSQVRHLQGLLPICSYCKRVRADENYWQSVEQYITERTDAEFTHSICPHCLPGVLAEVRRDMGQGG